MIDFPHLNLGKLSVILIKCYELYITLQVSVITVTLHIPVHVRRYSDIFLKGNICISIS